MDRYIAFLKIFILAVLFIPLQGLQAQSQSDLVALLQKYKIDPTEIAIEKRSQIESRIKELQEAGSSEEEIVNSLRAEGLLPPIAEAVGVDSTNTATPVESTTKAEESSSENSSEIEIKELPIPEALTEEERANLVFGQEVFLDTTGAFIRAIPNTPPDSYQIGRGDVFNVTIWGCSELSESLVVADDGSISRPYLGKVYLEGLPYAQAIRILEGRYRRHFAACSQIEIFMGRSKRTISVNIVGEVKRPGAYKINAASPAFNALFEAGGITEKGSVRNISIKRDGKIVQVLDIYEYLIGGEDRPIFLQNNDFIFVPVQDKIVKIQGAVQREAIYELREDEHLKSLVFFSGGLNFFARTDKARIDRFELGQRSTFTIDLSQYIGENMPDYNLVEGDEIWIGSQNLQLKKYVRVVGSVQFPNIYQFEDGDRISDLVTRAGGLSEDAMLGQAYILRKEIGSFNLTYIPVDLAGGVGKNPITDVPLRNRDVLYIFSNIRMAEEKLISINGEVRSPGIFGNSRDLNLKTLLFLANGPSNVANYQYIELMLLPRLNKMSSKQIERFLSDNPDPSVQKYREQVLFSRRIAISENWQNDLSLDSVLLFPFNQVHIYSKYKFIQREQVKIEGVVSLPGNYPLEEGMNLKDLIYQAQGILGGYDKIEVELHRKIKISEKGNFGTKEIDNEILRFSVDRDWEQQEGLDQISLAGIERVILIPDEAFEEKTYIDIKGRVNKPGVYQLEPNMTLKDLLYQAEGPRIDADLDNIELTRIIEIRENGKIIPTPVVVDRISIDQDWQADKSLDEISINAFDQIFIRKNPDFELQESVFLVGEFIVPGEYNKIRKNERMSSLVKRANGLTELADLEGAQIFRQGFSGPISLKLKKALSNPGGKFDIALLEGDSLYIPPLQNTVTIRGNVLRNGVTVIYEKGKSNYKYYVRKYAGGFARRTLKRENTITYADGSVRGPRRFFWKKFYPKVEQGSVINVAKKPEKKKKEKDGENRPRINTQELIASLTAILTFAILLRNSLNN
ncbi:MAG: SLBB domain-containing protein [Bacteroidota bacterium]